MGAGISLKNDKRIYSSISPVFIHPFPRIKFKFYPFILLFIKEKDEKFFTPSKIAADQRLSGYH